MAQRAPSAPSDRVMPPPPRRIGVLALQGAVREHAEAIRDVGAEPVLVRLPADLEGLDALILPGGESTAMRRLIDRYGLREPILAMARPRRADARHLRRHDPAGRSADRWRACRVRPAWTWRSSAMPTAASWTRSRPIWTCRPWATSRCTASSSARRWWSMWARESRSWRATTDGRPIAVRQGRVLATAFHPELTADRRLHRLLLELIPE